MFLNGEPVKVGNTYFEAAVFYSMYGRYCRINGVLFTFLFDWSKHIYFN